MVLTASLFDLQDACPICLEPFLLDTSRSTLGSQGITQLHPSDISVHLITREREIEREREKGREREKDKREKERERERGRERERRETGVRGRICVDTL